MLKKISCKLVLLTAVACMNHIAVAAPQTELPFNFQPQVSPVLADSIHKIFARYQMDEGDFKMAEAEIFKVARLDDRIVMVNVEYSSVTTRSYFVDLINKRISTDADGFSEAHGSVTDLSGKNWHIWEYYVGNPGSVSDYSAVRMIKTSAKEYQMEVFPLFLEMEFSEAEGMTPKEVGETLCFLGRSSSLLTFLKMKINHGVKSHADSIDVDATKVTCPSNKQRDVKLRFVPTKNGFSAGKGYDEPPHLVKVEWKIPDSGK